jgi:type IV pilus assembly protein PilP
MGMKYKKAYMVIAILGIAFAILLIGGCDRGGAPKGKSTSSKIIVTRKPPPRAETAKANVNKLKENVQQPAYRYDPVGKRDPFRPFLAMKAPIKPEGEQVALTPLQKYDVSQLKLVAICMTGDTASAMVEDAEGKGFMVTEGTYIGRNYGKVTSISKDGVLVEEKYKDYLGKVRTKEITLELYVPGEEKTK